MDKICNHCNNYDRETRECQGEPSDYVNGSSDNVIWFKPPPNFSCTYWKEDACLKEYITKESSRCECPRCRDERKTELDRDEDSGVLK